MVVYVIDMVEYGLWKFLGFMIDFLIGKDFEKLDSLLSGWNYEEYVCVSLEWIDWESLWFWI